MFSMVELLKARPLLCVVFSESVLFSGAEIVIVALLFSSLYCCLVGDSMSDWLPVEVVRGARKLGGIRDICINIF